MSSLGGGQTTMRRCGWLKWLFAFTIATWVIGIQPVFCDLGGRQFGVLSYERVASAAQSGAYWNLDKSLLLRRNAMEYSLMLLTLMVVSYVIHGFFSSA